MTSQADGYHLVRGERPSMRSRGERWPCQKYGQPDSCLTVHVSPDAWCSHCTDADARMQPCLCGTEAHCLITHGDHSTPAERRA